MKYLFLKVLSMSGTGAVVILLVLLARLVLRGAPKKFSYVLWAVVLLRLLCPFSLKSQWSLIPYFRVEPAGVGLPMMAIDLSQAEVTVWVDDPPVVSAKPAAPSAPSAVSAPSAPAPAESAPLGWRTVAAVVWLTGAALLLAYSALSLLRLRRRLVGVVPLEGEDRVFLADHIPSPFVLGVFKPKIYLPSDLEPEERAYILLHERTHIRRLDHITRALAWLAVAVHWFNPLVWLAFHLAGKDMEMSCDEAVLLKMGQDIRSDYSNSLLRLSVGGRLPAGPLAFGDGDPAHRIKNVLRYKKPARWVLALAFVAALCSGVALATDPERPIDPDSVVSVTDANYPAHVPMDPVYTMPHDLATSVEITGLDCGSARWFCQEFPLRPAYGTPEKALGYLDLSEPRFLGENFAEAYVSVSAVYSPEDDPNLVWLNLSAQGGVKGVFCTVDLATGVITDRETHLHETAPTVLTDQEMLSAAQAVAQLIQGAYDYYTAATGVTE